MVPVTDQTVSDLTRNPPKRLKSFSERADNRIIIVTGDLLGIVGKEVAS